MHTRTPNSAHFLDVISNRKAWLLLVDVTANCGKLMKMVLLFCGDRWIA